MAPSRRLALRRILFLSPEIHGRPGLKVLIVDDDRAMRELIKRIIGDRADEFCECDTEEDALAVFRASFPGVLPDWVLMDIRITDGDGLTATQRITAAHPEARVLIVTSFNDASLREAACKAGAVGYVLKENLLELQQWLRREGGEQRD